MLSAMPPMPAERHSWTQTTVITIAALCLYLALTQKTMHADGPLAVTTYARGFPRLNNHLLYFYFIDVACLIGRPLGLATVTSMMAASVVGTALGVLFLHRAALHLGMSGTRAALLAGMCAVAPGVVFYATLVEIHGVFFGCAAFSILVATRCAASPSLLLAAALGVSTAIATGVHTTGHLLLAVTLPVMVIANRESAASRRSPRVLMCLSAMVVAVHALASLLLIWWLNPTALRGQSSQLFMAPAWNISRLPGVIRREWLVAFLPLSILWLVGFIRRRDRWLALALLAALVPYLAPAFLLLQSLDDHGAYLLPLAFPAAWICARVLPSSLLGLTIAMAATLAVAQVRTQDALSDTAPTPAAVRALLGDQRIALLVANKSEIAPFMHHDPTTWTGELSGFSLVNQYVDAETPDRAIANVLVAFDHLYELTIQEGRQLLATERFVDTLRELGRTKVAAARFAELLRQRYTLTELSRDGLRLHRFGRNQ